MITTKMKDLLISQEEKVFYLSNCLRDADFVEVQLQDGLDPRRIRWDLEFSRQCCRHNDLAQRVMELIVEELMEAASC